MRKGLKITLIGLGVVNILPSIVMLWGTTLFNKSYPEMQGMASIPLCVFGILLIMVAVILDLEV